MEGPGFWIAAVIAAVLVGMSKGGLPVVGMLGVPVLALAMPPVAAAGLLLPVFVLSDLFGLYAYRRAYDLQVLKIMVPATTIGVGLGWLTASVVSDRLVGIIVGLIGAVFALSMILRRGAEPPPRPARMGPGIFWGIITGFTSFVSHAGGPPYQVFVLPLRMEKAIFAGTTTILFAYVNAIKLIPYWALGQLSLANLRVAAILTVPAVIAVFAGFWLVRVLPTKLFFRLVVWALLAVSLKLLWDAT